jgi:hypothetical protein
MALNGPKRRFPARAEAKRAAEVHAARAAGKRRLWAAQQFVELVPLLAGLKVPPPARRPPRVISDFHPSKGVADNK